MNQSMLLNVAVIGGSLKHLSSTGWGVKGHHETGVAGNGGTGGWGTFPNGTAPAEAR